MERIMNMLWKRKRVFAWITAAGVILGALLAVSFENRILVYAGTDGHEVHVEYNGDGTQTVYTVYNDGVSEVQEEVLTFDFSDDKYFIMSGKHMKTGASIYYRTNGYNFTLEPANGTPAVAANGKVKLTRYMGRDWKDEEQGENIIRSYYYIPWTTMTEDGVTYRGLYDAIDTLAERKYGDDYIRNIVQEKGIVLYMSNVFEVRHKTGNEDRIISGQESIETYEEMRNAQSWSQGTRAILGAYYDIPIKIEKVYFPTYKVHTNCVACASKWINSGFTEMNQFNDFCHRHNKDSGIWCEKTYYGDRDGEGNEVYTYTRADGTVKQVQQLTYRIRSDSCVHADSTNTVRAGDEWSFDGSCSDWSVQKGAVRQCGSIICLVDDKGKTVREEGYKDSDSGGLYELYAWNNRLQIKVSGNLAGRYDRAVIIPYFKDEESLKVTVKYADGITGAILNSNVAVLPVQAGDEYTYRIDMTTIPDGMGFLEDVPTGKYVYGADSEYEDVGLELTGNGQSFFIRHEEDMPAVLFVRLYKKQDTEEETSVTEEGISYFDCSAHAVLQSDSFDVEKAIPSTEEMYAELKTRRYLFNCKIKKVSGSKNYSIIVKQPYTLQFKTSDGGDGSHEDGESEESEEVYETRSEVISAVVNVKREYSYYELVSLDYYVAGYADIYSNSMRESVFMMYGDDYPDCDWSHYIGQESHLTEPELPDYVVLPEIILTSEDTTVPEPVLIDMNLATEKADEAIDEFRVRNDRLYFDNISVMGDEWQDKSTGEVQLSLIRESDFVTLRRDNIVIPAEKKNSVYDSVGYLTYRRVSRYNSPGQEYLTYALQVNSVSVHTPVYCNGIISADNNKYVQLVNPDSSRLQLVIGRSDSLGSEGHENDSCDFAVKVSNVGTHLQEKGYRNRDYGRNYSGREGGSYVAHDNDRLMNQIRFPFDVILDVNNNRNEQDDRLIAAHTWYTIGGNTERFYLPMWVREGEYRVHFRTMAVNGTDRTEYTEQNANLSSNNYIATDTAEIQISGKLYNLTLYDTDEQTEWKDVFRLGYIHKLNYPDRYPDGTLLSSDFSRVNAYSYTVGQQNEMGLATGRKEGFIVPMISGSNIKYKNLGVLKAGYTWRFKLETVGEKMSSDDSSVRVRPSFYWISHDGTKRERVKLYYVNNHNGHTTLTLVGSEEDLLNRHYNYPGNENMGIPQHELVNTAHIRGCDIAAEWSGLRGETYAYGGIVSNILFKTFSNDKYVEHLKNGNISGSVNKSESDLRKLKQTYYFEYSLPKKIHAAPIHTDIFVEPGRGISFTEDFWKKDGYILVNFDISAFDAEDKEYLSYSGSNIHYGNMWSLEGFKRQRTDYYGTQFQFDDGDIFMLHTDKTVEDDFECDLLN